MAMDVFKNFAYSMVVVAPMPPNLGTTLTVPSGHSARFPPPPFSVSVWPIGLPADPTNAEIIRVTAIADDVWTIQRAREATHNRAIEVNDQIAQAMTVQTLADLKADVAAAAQGNAASQVAALRSYLDTTFPTSAYMESRIDTRANEWRAAWEGAGTLVTSAQLEARAAAHAYGQAIYYYTALRNEAYATFGRIVPRVNIITSAAGISPDIDNYDMVVVDSLWETLSIFPPVGTSHDGQQLVLRFRDNSVAQSLSWAAWGIGSGGYGVQNKYIALPGQTRPYATLHCGFRYNRVYGLWVLLALTEE